MDIDYVEETKTSVKNIFYIDFSSVLGLSGASFVFKLFTQFSYANLPSERDVLTRSLGFRYFSIIRYESIDRMIYEGCVRELELKIWKILNNLTNVLKQRLLGNG